MLEQMRNAAQSWIAKVLLGGIVLSFGLWGVGDYFTSSQLEVVAEVDGEPVSQLEFAQAYERQSNQYREMFGKSLTREMLKAMDLPNQTVQTIINRRIMLKEAEALGLAAPDEVLLAQVQNNPAFQNNGKFDPNRYQMITRNSGFRTPADFEAEERLNVIVNTLQQSIAETTYISEAQVRAKFQRDFETRVIEGLIVDAASLEHGITVSDAQARSYYEAHKDRYHSPARVKFNLVVIDPFELSREVAVTEEDIKAAYEAKKDSLQQPEKRKASHILVKVAAGADAATKAAARKKIEAALARVKGGEDFAKVAKEISDDSSAAQGGDLGFFPKGMMVKPFEDAVFTMQVGQISPIVETDFGFHVIKLAEIQAPHAESLAEARAAIANEMILEKARDEAANRARSLEDALGSESDLIAAANKAGLTLRAIGPVSADEAMADPVFAGNPEFRTQAFALNKGDFVEVRELSNGQFAAIEVAAKSDPQPRPYTEAVADVHRDALRDQANAAAKKLASQIVAEAASSSFDQLAQKYGLAKLISKPTRANGQGGDAEWISGELLASAFALPKGGTVKSPVETSKGLVVARVAEVSAPSSDEFAKEAPALRDELKRSEASSRFSLWISGLRERHSIKVHEDQLKRF